MRILSGVVGVLLLGAGSIALADEPVRLDAAEMDMVTAGIWNGGGLAFTFGGTAQGNVNNFFELSQAGFVEQTNLTPTTFEADAQAFASAQLRSQSIGVGATSTSGAGGVYTIVFQ